MALKHRLAAWEAAGIVDSATVARIEAFETSGRSRDGQAITAGEMVAYAGSVVLLVGLGFLYGTQYAGLGAGGRLLVLALVVAGGGLAGELIRRMGAGLGAASRSRAAGWTVATVAASIWITQACVDNHILTKPPLHHYAGAPDDVSGAIMLGALVGLVVATTLLRRSDAGLLALAASVLAYTAIEALDSYIGRPLSPWQGAATWLGGGLLLAVLAETILRSGGGSWAREILRFAALTPVAIAALVFSFQDGGGSLEYVAPAVAVAGFVAAYLRGSGGYAIGGAVALLIVVNEVGFRHFATSVGFPVVLIASGLTLFAVAGGLFRLLPRLRPPAAQRGL